eukprot:CAMPEP_0184035628 /NCGR_PEP_ID=MMETSP0955-20130417/27340_1 /TAXON_ID=627963 /ORGANISM="Aplanochytrium sp, Strain PBS07" /LENGTH=280 /DNA_ID=CAMNT_0026322869 /DNA_START=11 /DNA_END=853 /DNA_ORIENTATION=-
MSLFSLLENIAVYPMLEQVDPDSVMISSIMTYSVHIYCVLEFLRLLINVKENLDHGFSLRMEFFSEVSISLDVFQDAANSPEGIASLFGIFCSFFCVSGLLREILKGNILIKSALSSLCISSSIMIVVVGYQTERRSYRRTSCLACWTFLAFILSHLLNFLWGPKLTKENTKGRACTQDNLTRRTHQVQDSIESYKPESNAKIELLKETYEEAKFQLKKIRVYMFRLEAEAEGVSDDGSQMAIHSKIERLQSLEQRLVRKVRSSQAKLKGKSGSKKAGPE